MSRLAWTSLAGALGTAARYLLSLWIARHAATSLPLGTLAVNCVGSFLLSFLMQTALSTALVSPTLRIVVATGFLGGFTTYSTFNYETLQLAGQSAWIAAGGNVAATVGGCLVSGFAGFALARAIFGG